MTDETKDECQREQDAGHRPPTLLGWIVRLVSLALVALLFSTLIYQMAQPPRDIMFETKPLLDESYVQDSQVLVPVEITNRGSSPAHDVRLIVGDGTQEQTVEILSIGQNETLTYVIAFDRAPGPISARIESYAQS